MNQFPISIITRLNIFLILLASCAIFLAQCSSPASTAKTTETVEKTGSVTVYLVRHAEKGTQPASDPALSEFGKLRAGELATKLIDSGVTAIYTSQYRRTRETAEPLARQLGITAKTIAVELSTVKPGEPSPAYLATMVREIRGQRGGKVLVIGHSNTVPAIIQALGGEAVPAIGEETYNDFFIVTLDESGDATVARMKYGS